MEGFPLTPEIIEKVESSLKKEGPPNIRVKEGEQPPKQVGKVYCKDCEHKINLLPCYSNHKYYCARIHKGVSRSMNRYVSMIENEYTEERKWIDLKDRECNFSRNNKGNCPHYKQK